ncbi:MAG: GAF domain-containing protein [Chloroflexi bacterium]|nr:MAG: GAF domain-containing protein [Chloroflexota bacterium]
MAGQEPASYRYQGLEGDQVIGVLEPIEGTHWAVVVEVPTREAFAGLRRMVYLLVGTLVAAALLAGGLGLLLPRRIIRPLRLLQEGAAAVGAGQLEHVIRVRTNDELEELAEAFNTMAARLRESRAQLERWGQELEQQVEERTAELAEASERLQRRASQFQAIAEVGRTITLVGDLDQMLTQITQRISERFGFYHVGVFLLDEVGEYAVLRAANSEGGQRMLARGHRLKVGETGIVGYVTATGEPRIALDVGEDAVWFNNPDLPLTRSELALPLKVGDETIGALDVQSTEEAAFTEEDVTVLSMLADQVAIAIQNARLLAQTQQALAEVEETHRQYLRRAWREVVARRGPLVYEYARTGTPSLKETLLPEMKRAIERGEVVAMPIADGDGGGGAAAGSALAVPIKLRGQVIGVIDLQEIGDGRKWTEEEIALVRAISDQMALAAENVRLLEETERRAAWEHQVQAITSRIRRSPDLATILQTTVEELGRVLGADRALVRLKVGLQEADQEVEE